MTSTNHNSLLTIGTAGAYVEYIINKCARVEDLCDGRISLMQMPIKPVDQQGVPEKTFENNWIGVCAEKLRVPLAGPNVYGAARVDTFGLLNKTKKPKLND